MSSFKRPDVYVQEVLPRQYVGVGVSADAQPTLVGACTRGPLVPTLVNNWSDFTKQFGGFESSAFLSYAAFQYFGNGGGPLLVVRAAGSGATQATRTFNDTAGTPVPTLTIKAKNPGAWGNSLYITVIANTTGAGKFDLIVKLGGTADGNIVERYSALSIDPADARYAPAYVASYSDYITATDLNSATTLAQRAPAASVDQVLASGADGSAVTSTELITAYHTLDLVQQPLVVALPGVTDNTTLTDVLSSAAAGGRNFIIVDVPVYTAVADYLTYTGALPVTDFAAVYGPWLKINDPSKTNVSVLKSVPPSGAVLGRFSSTDVAEGPYRTPAGTSEGRLSGVVDVEKTFANADLDSLNVSNSPVNVIRPLTNRGICVMGGRTLNGTTATRYVANRRSLVYIRQSITDLCQFAVFEPNDEDLWDTLTQTCTQFLSEYRGQGGLRGTDDASAFYVRCDSTINTPLSIANGEVHVEVGVALEYPAEFVVVRLGLFEGGSTASETA